MPISNRSASRTHTTDQLPVNKTHQDDCERVIVNKATKHATSDTEKRLGSSEMIALE
ncbi:hypothetical protein LY78DRAFT_654171 [Colletotrichum sublineola]|nr:hypothetical protein LY78DRAFT_654171 [Colletotrichum sublineola]